MAQKTRTAQVFDVVKVLAWVVIAVALVKFAFFPAAQEKQTSDGVDPGGSFGQMTISVGRADITNTVTLTGTIQPDEPVVARATLDGNVVRTFVNDGDKVSKGDALLQIRKEIPGDTRQVTDESGNVSVETTEPTYKYETVKSPRRWHGFDGRARGSAVRDWRHGCDDCPPDLLRGRLPEPGPDVPHAGRSFDGDRYH